MEYIQTDFSKELSDLFLKYKKAIESDKSGIYIVDNEIGISFLITKSETASEDYRDKLISIRGSI